jgi:hypothetical protein
MKKGDKVRCIDGSANPKFRYESFNFWLIEGHVYTVRRFEVIEGIERLLLENMKNKATQSIVGPIEAAYSKNRFILNKDYPEYAKKRPILLI